MKISVVICTHNRASSLKRTLASLTRQTLSHDAFEVLVVDNASTDNTKQVVNSCTDISATYIFEAKIGLSRARNTGWRAAQSPYVAFLDDDAEAAPKWLETIIMLFETSNTTPLAVGGTVSLLMSHSSPHWLSSELRSYLSELVCTEKRTELNNTAYYLHGCNMAFSRSTLEYYCGFYEGVGRKGESLLSGAEIILQKNIISDGGKILYHPEASVLHHVSAARLLRRWMIKRSFWEGVSSARIEALLKNNSRKDNLVHIVTSLKMIWCDTNRKDIIISLNNAENFTKLCRKVKYIGRVISFVQLTLKSEP